MHAVCSIPATSSIIEHRTTCLSSSAEWPVIPRPACHESLVMPISMHPDLDHHHHASRHYTFRNCILLFLLPYTLPNLRWHSHAHLCDCLFPSAVNPLQLQHRIPTTSIERETCLPPPESHSTTSRQTCQRATSSPWLSSRTKLCSSSTLLPR